MTDAELDRELLAARMGHEPSAQRALIEIADRMLLGKRLPGRALEAILTAILYNVEANSALRFLLPQQRPHKGAPRKANAPPALVQALVVAELRAAGYTDSISKPGGRANLYEEAARRLGAEGDIEIERGAERLRQAAKRARREVLKRHPELGDELKHLSRVRRRRGT